MDGVYTGHFLGLRGTSFSLNLVAGDSTPCWDSGTEEVPGPLKSNLFIEIHN